MKNPLASVDGLAFVMACIEAPKALRGLERRYWIVRRAMGHAAWIWRISPRG